MTITAAATKYRYEGNGVTATFSYLNRVYAQTDLKVDLLTRSTSALVETLTLTTDYTVTIAANGQATVTITNATKIPSVTQDILVRLDLPLTQATELPTGTAFPAKSVEDAVDKLTSIAQALAEVDTRTLKFSAQSPVTSAVIADPVDGATLVFDGTTGAIAAGPDAGDITDAAANAATATAKAAEAAASAATIGGFDLSGAQAADDAILWDTGSSKFVRKTLAYLAGLLHDSPTFTGTVTADTIKTSGSSGVAIKNSGGTTVLTVGPTNTTNATFAGALNAQKIGLSAGTTSIAPITLTSGTNLTTATAGSFEYDGKVIYATPQSTQRGVVSAEQWYRLDAGLAGANGTSAQNALGVSFGVSASTVYEFEAVINLSKSAGTTSHNLSWLFGGTASINNISYQVTGDSSVVSFTSGFGTRFSAAPQVATAIALYSGLTSAALFVVLNIKGTVSVNAAGTLTPQYILSAAPGGAYTTAQGSYFKIKPIGASGANVSVGNIT